MGDESGSRHKTLFAINVAVGVVVVVAVVIAARKPLRKAVDSEQPSVVQEEHQPVALPAKTQAAVAPVAADPTVNAVLFGGAGEDVPYGGADFQREVPAHMSVQTETLLKEMENAQMDGRTNDPLVLSREKILELEKKGNMIF